MRRILALVGLVFLLAAADNAFGQGNGQVSGTVQDPAKALIPGVTITLTNTATGVISTQVSNESGVYSFASVPPGSYKLTGSLPGFKTAVFNDVAVGTSAQVRLNITMQLGEVTSQVEVSASAQQLLTESSASIGEVLSQARVADLPMVRGDVLDLVRIMPGMRVDPFGDQFSAFTGLPTNTINTTRDGLSVTDTRNNILSGTTTMNPDLVGEIRIILSPVDAEFGRGNGQIQIQTRSGTNKYTGSAVWNIRNTGLAANTWLNNRNIDPFTKEWSPTPLDWRNTHQITLSYGGPILKNKTFFFALWDQNISRTRTLVTNNVLTDTARQGIFRYFDFWNGGDARTTIPTFPASATTGVYPVVDAGGSPVAPAKNPDGSPYTGSLRCYSVFGNIKADGSPFTQADCAGGIAMIGAAWDPLRAAPDSTGYIKKLIASMPHANYWFSGATTVDGLNLAQFRWLRGSQGLSGGGGQAGTSPESINRKQINIKIDHNLNLKNRLSVGYTYQADDNADNIAAWPGGFNGNSLRRPQVFTSNFTSTLSSTIVNEGRFGISYQYNEVNPAWKSSDAAVSNGASALLLQGSTNAATGGVYPVAFSPGAGNYAFGNNLINNNSTYSGSGSPLYSFADTLSWTRAKHAFRMGGEVRLTRSTGYAGSVFPTASGGAGGNTSLLVNTIAGLPNQLAANRTNAANMLYLLSGSVNSASMLYWIASGNDTKNGTWQDYVTAGRRERKQVENEWDLFFKDDWKVTPHLTFNLGLRYEFYGSPYLKGGFTASVVGQGNGLFGAGIGNTDKPFDSWMAPGNLYLSGYGPNVSAASALQCTTGQAQNALLPAATCDPTKLTTIEYVGPASDHPNKTVIPNDWNNFGPAIGFAWQLPWFGEGKTSVRGGFSVTYGVASRSAATIENLIGNIPGASSTANTVLGDFTALTTGRALRLSDLPALVPVRPTSPALPGGQVPVINRATSFIAYDPTYATPYTENLTFSVTRAVSRNVTVDVRYEGTLGRKRGDSAFGLGGAFGGGLNLNLPNVYYNKELFDALEVTRQGGNAPLFDQMFAGLNLSGQTTNGYGPVGTCVNAPAGTPGLGLEGCAANQVFNHGSAHLRRNATFTSNLAIGNYDAVASSLNTLSTVTVASGPGALQSLPAGVTGVSGRVLRNGCDRLAANLTTIPTRCFPENYVVANPQLSTASFIGNLGKSNYHSLQTQFTLRPVMGISFQTTYTWSKTLGLVPGGYTDPLNRNADYAPPYQAVAHDLRTNGTFELPIGPNKLLFANSSGWVARLIEHWQTSVIFNVSSGNPRTIIGAHTRYASGSQNLDIAQSRVNIVSSAFDQAMKGHAVWNGTNNDSGLYYGDKFVIVKDPGCDLTNRVDSMGFNLSGNCSLNAIAMKNADGTTGPIVLQNPAPGGVGNMPFSLEAPGKWKFDANLGKTFRLTESKSLQVRFDAQNVLNHPDLADPTPQTGQTINSITTFGQIPTKGGSGSGAAPRTFQAQLRLTF